MSVTVLHKCRTILRFVVRTPKRPRLLHVADAVFVTYCMIDVFSL